MIHIANTQGVYEVGSNEWKFHLRTENPPAETVTPGPVVRRCGGFHDTVDALYSVSRDARDEFGGRDRAHVMAQVQAKVSIIQSQERNEKALELAEHIDQIAEALVDVPETLIKEATHLLPLVDRPVQRKLSRSVYQCR